MVLLEIGGEGSTLRGGHSMSLIQEALDKGVDSSIFKIEVLRDLKNVDIVSK